MRITRLFCVFLFSYFVLHFYEWVFLFFTERICQLDLVKHYYHVHCFFLAFSNRSVHFRCSLFSKQLNLYSFCRVFFYHHITNLINIFFRITIFHLSRSKHFFNLICFLLSRFFILTTIHVKLGKFRLKLGKYFWCKTHKNIFDGWLSIEFALILGEREKFDYYKYVILLYIVVYYEKNWLNENLIVLLSGI